MTTIVIYNGVVAYDSRCTNTDNVTERFGVDKVQMERGRIFAFAGDADLFQPLKRWIIRGAKIEALPKFKRPKNQVSFEIIEIGRGGMRVWSDDALYPTPVIEPVCIGSGYKFARGAIEVGKLLGVPIHAMDAVQAAAEADANTGYPIKAIDINKSLEMGAPVRRLRRRRNSK